MEQNVHQENGMWDKQLDIWQQVWNIKEILEVKQ